MSGRTTADGEAGTARGVRWRLPRRVLLTVLTAHIVLSVGLLGDSAGFVAVGAGSPVSRSGGGPRESSPGRGGGRRPR